MFSTFFMENLIENEPLHIGVSGKNYITITQRLFCLVYDRVCVLFDKDSNH